MSRDRLAAAYEELAVLHVQLSNIYGQVAHELMGTEQAAGGASPVHHQGSPAAAAPSCPEHGPEKRRPGKKGGYYCSYNRGTRDDPDWCSWRVA